MCTRTFCNHLCGHSIQSPLTTCGTPSLQGHYTNLVIATQDTPCPTCSGGSFPSFQPNIAGFDISTYYSSGSPQIFQLPPQYIPYQPAQPTPPSYSPYQAPAQPVTPHFNFSGIIPADNVPSWIPREVRYENIRGVLTPVEHFRGVDIGMEGKRGWNSVHGWDIGPSPLNPQNHGWNPIHGFDTGNPPPFIFGPTSTLPVMIFGQENVENGISAVLQSGPQEIENGGTQGGDSSARPSSASPSPAPTSPISPTQPSSGKKSPTPLKSAMKKGKDPEPTDESTEVADNGEASSSPGPQKSHKRVRIQGDVDGDDN